MKNELIPTGGIPHYSEEDNTAVAWLTAYMETNSISQASMARQLGLTSSPLNKVLKGTYEASPEPLLARIRDYKALTISRTMRGPDVGFVQTELANRIWTACDRARQFQWLIRIQGASQMGKTVSVKRYAELNPDAVILVELDTKPRKMGTARRLCRAARLTEPWSSDEAWVTLTGYLTPRHLVIVDEAHYAIEEGRNGIVEVLDWLRKLHDATGCGMALVVTPLYSTHANYGACKDLLVQIDRRGETEYLPDVPSMADMRKIWTAYGLPEPDSDTRAIITRLGKHCGFGKYTKRLITANFDAAKDGQPLTWDRFVATHNRLSATNQ